MYSPFVSPTDFGQKIHRVAYPYHLLNSNTGIIPKKRLEAGTEKEQKPILIGPFVSRRSICDCSVCRTWVLGVLSLLCYSGAPVHPEQWNKKSKSLYKSQQFYKSKNMRCAFKAALCSRSPWLVKMSSYHHSISVSSDFIACFFLLCIQ